MLSISNNGVKLQCVCVCVCVYVRVREGGMWVVCARVCAWCARARMCVVCVRARVRGVCARVRVCGLWTRVCVCVCVCVWGGGGGGVRARVRIRNRKGYSRLNNFTSAKLSIFVTLSDITHLYIPLMFTFIEIVSSFLPRIVEYSTSPFPGVDHFPNIASGDPNAAHVNVTDETLTFTMGGGFIENPSCLVRSCIYFRALPV